MKKKTVALLLALTLVLGVVAGGTIAWLTAETTPVKNTFTTSDIDITLTETVQPNNEGNREFKMTPGYTIDKDPKVTVLKGSEACYLFVKVEESENLETYISYTMANGWLQLKNEKNEVVSGVFYREVAADSNDQEFGVIGYMSGKTFVADKVLVKDTVTKAMMETAKTSAPTLTFTAYASQLYKSNTAKFTPAEAWANAQPTVAP